MNCIHILGCPYARNCSITHCASAVTVLDEAYPKLLEGCIVARQYRDGASVLLSLAELDVLSKLVYAYIRQPEAEAKALQSPAAQGEQTMTATDPHQPKESATTGGAE